MEPGEPIGTATLDPLEAVTAGAYGTWRLTFRAGPSGVASGGRLHVHTDSDTDWGVPQMQDPAGADYLTVTAPAGVGTYVLMPSAAVQIVGFHGRGLRAGEVVTLTYGDRSGGGPGTRAQTFAESKRYFRVDVDVTGNGTIVSLPDPPWVSVVGGEAYRLLVTAPSTVTVGRPFSLQICMEDRWGNPASYRGEVELSGSGMMLPSPTAMLREEDKGVYWLAGCIVPQEGWYTVTAREGQLGLSATSNPILCRQEGNRHQIYWGDFHGGQVADAAKIGDFFHHARHVAALDFAAYQRNDYAISTSDWVLQQEMERAFHEPGRFVPIPGYEWSPKHPVGGHHNVFFRRHGQSIRRSSHRGLKDKSDLATDLPHVLALYEAFRGRDAVITPHVGGVASNLTWHEPSLEPAIEVVSTHGTFEWFLKEAIERGYKVGFLGGSDSTTGRPGNDRPGFQARRFAKSGLSAVYAEEMTLPGLLAGLKARRCYATTGARIVALIMADGHMMGQEYTAAAPPTLTASVTGTAPLEAVELFRGVEKIYAYPLHLPGSPNRIRILWEGASRRTSYSAVVWEGEVRIRNGRLVDASVLRFDSPRSHLQDRTAHGVRWHAVTCGYRSGVILELEENDDTVVDLTLAMSLVTGPEFGGYADTGPRKMSQTPPESFTVTISPRELAADPLTFDLGILDRKLTLSLAPEAGSAHQVDFQFVDQSPQAGNNAYWMRVVQTDLEMAWTSPVFVDYVAADDTGQ